MQTAKDTQARHEPRHGTKERPTDFRLRAALQHPFDEDIRTMSGTAWKQITLHNWWTKGFLHHTLPWALLQSTAQGSQFCLIS